MIRKQLLGVKLTPAQQRRWSKIVEKDGTIAADAALRKSIIAKRWRDSYPIAVVKMSAFAAELT